MKTYLLAAAAALALAGPAWANDPTDDPVLSPEGRARAENEHIPVHYDPVASEILLKMRDCIIGEAWGLPGAATPHRTGLVLADHCYRTALGRP
jgi:hypothetical protein